MSMCMRFVAIVMAAGLFFTACKKEKKIPDEAFEPLPTPVGNVYGQATTATIGSQGGVVTTPDGKVQVTVPAGALSANTTISLQPVENTTPGGIGLNYRLLPHGTQFAKPVTIKFSYAQYIDSVSSPDVLAIAFQDADRVWKIPQGYTLNKNAKEISVQSLHFSDWSVMEYLFLYPVKGVVYTGEQLELEAFSEVEITDDLQIKFKGDEDRLLAPLGKGWRLNEKHVKEWKLVGEGSLAPHGNTATYTAPGELPAQNPVTVTLQLKSTATLLLLSNIDIVPTSGVWIKLDDKEYLNYKEAKLTKDNGGLSLDWTKTQGGAWQGNIGIADFAGGSPFTWSEDNQFWYEEPLRVGTHTVMSFIDVGTHSVPSQGYFKILNWDGPGGMVSGEFKITNAGEYDANGSGAFIKQHTVTGSFNVKRQQ